MKNILELINLYDVIFVVIVFISFLICYKNGLLYSLVSFFKVIGSAIGAGYISKNYSLLIYERFFKDSLISKVAEELSNFRDGLVDSFDNNVIGKAISDYLSRSALGDDVEAISERIVNDTIQDTIVSGFQIILFVLAFIVFVALISWVQNILLHTNDVPVLGFMNQMLGGLFGALIALIILFIIAMILNILINYNVPYLYRDDILNSYLFSYIYKLNPFYK
ncbi:MAG: CvpA family protein [Oscillospiraceae bacterium]|nr:CvpA family protein [Oscillospiraceae bacterium]